MRRVAGVIAVLVVIAGCRKSDGRSPMQSAIDETTEQLHDSIHVGLRATARQAPFTVPVRYNPAECACPEYEIYAYGHWVRVFIDADDSSRASLDRLRANTLATAEIRGRLAPQLRIAESRVRYPVFLLD